jgi:hypothetical protein
MAYVAPARVTVRLARGLRRLAGVGGLMVNLHHLDDGLPRTTWLGLAVGEVGISEDSDLGNSTNGAGSSLN